MIGGAGGEAASEGDVPEAGAEETAGELNAEEGGNASPAEQAPAEPTSPPVDMDAAHDRAS